MFVLWPWGCVTDCLQRRSWLIVWSLVFFSLQLLVEVCPKAVIEETMLTPVLGLAKDPVPNVRFNAAKTLTKLAPHISKEWVTRLFQESGRESLIMYSECVRSKGEMQWMSLLPRNFSYLHMYEQPERNLEGLLVENWHSLPGISTLPHHSPHFEPIWLGQFFAQVRTLQALEEGMLGRKKAWFAVLKWDSSRNFLKLCKIVSNWSLCAGCYQCCGCFLLH